MNSSESGTPTYSNVIDQSPCDLLSDVEHFIRRFCTLPSEDAFTAVTLWAAHTHMVEHFHTTPRLALLSAEPSCGKTRVLDVLALLTRESVSVVNVTAASIFRRLARSPMTLQVDECDAIFTQRGKSDTHEDLRALLNSGYKRGAMVSRCSGSNHDVKDFPVFCAVALAGLGDLPDTILTRSVIIQLRRRTANEPIESFRIRFHESQGHHLRDRLAVWAKSAGAVIGDSVPKLPAGIDNRPAEVWEPLVAIADAAGGDWPERARRACVSMCALAEDRRVSLGSQLLHDLFLIFETYSAMSTTEILGALCDPESLKLAADAPWSSIDSRPLNSRRLASLLKPYGIRPGKVRTGGQLLQGYQRKDFADAWSRYLPHTSAEAEHPELPMPEKPSDVLAVPNVPAVPEKRDTVSKTASIQELVDETRQALGKERHEVVFDDEIPFDEEAPFDEEIPFD